MPLARIVVDIGNSRLKWGAVDLSGRLTQTAALPIDRPEAWAETWSLWVPDPSNLPDIAVSTVSPPIAAKFGAFLESRRTAYRAPVVSWLRSAADVAVPHRLAHPGQTGADRALAVLAALDHLPVGKPGLIVSCGTAITVERIGQDRIWQGGVIAVGLGLAARALNQNTAQLPLVEPGHLPAAWGNSTHPALAAGIFWGTVGGVREILTRQADDLPGPLAILWTGGDAEPIARAIAGTSAVLAPHLVLEGLIRASNWNAKS